MPARVSAALPAAALAALILVPVLLTGAAGRADAGSGGGSEPELGVYEPCPEPGDCDPRAVLSRLRDMGFNSVLVTAVDDDGALYDSDYIPREEEGWPPEGYLRGMVREAKSLGMRIYAWVNLPHGVWLSEHPDWIAVYSDGRPADYYSDDYFHSIVSPARVVREGECVRALRGIARELAEMGFDGIDLNDNFQFSDYYDEGEDRTLYTSYDEFTVSAFESDTGVEVPGSGPREWAEAIESDPDLWERWVDWRAEQVTELVRLVAEAGREVNPGLEVRPHLLIWWPLETYGEDYHALADVAGTLYVMVSSHWDWRVHKRAVMAAIRAGAERVVASTYLFGANESDDPGLFVRRRARWLASAGADGLYIFNYELMEEMGLWDEVRSALAEFERAWRLRRYGGYPGWLTGATVVSVYAEPGEEWAGVASRIGEALEEGASVIELDVGIGSARRMYDEREFEETLGFVRNVTSLVHSLGGRVVVYVPALEVDWGPGEPPPAEARGWFQVSLDGRPLVVSGENIDVPWLSPEETVAEMSPFSPHRGFVTDRAARLVSEGGADGVWLDVPHMPTWMTEEMSDLWPDASRWGARDFEERYWEDPPPEANLSDPAFRDWLEWRRWAVADFVSAVADSVWEAGGVLVVESSACDHEITELGYDPALFGGDPRVLQVAEVSPPGESGLGFGDLENWSHFLAMLKYSEAASRGKPLWFLNYGTSEGEAARQLGLILATSGSFFETNNDGLMTGTVGAGFRERAFRLVSALDAVGEDEADVGVLFSSRSLDLTGEAWGPYDPGESRHLRAFRDVVRELASSGVQFDVVPLDYASPGDLAEYDVLVAPDVEVLDREARFALSEFGGTLLVVGSLGVLDEGGWETDPLEAGERVSAGDLAGILAGSAGEISAPGGTLVEGGSAGACRFYSVVDVGAAGGTVSIPPGSWVLDFDSQSLRPSPGEEEVPRTFYLVITSPGPAPGGTAGGAYFWAPSLVDLEMNPEISGEGGTEPGLAGTVVAVGGPEVNPAAWEGADVEFVRAGAGGTYSGLRFGNETLWARFGREDYAAVWVQGCGNLTLARVAGVTRYGTRAGLLWALGRLSGGGGLPPGLTLLGWEDSDGDGSVDPGEVEVVLARPPP